VFKKVGITPDEQRTLLNLVICFSEVMKTFSGYQESFDKPMELMFKLLVTFY